MNLPKVGWSDENIRFQNRQNDFYLTDSGYKLKNSYLNSFNNLKLIDESNLINFICQSQHNKIISENFQSLLGDSNCNCLSNKHKEKLDKIKQERLNIIKLACVCTFILHLQFVFNFKIIFGHF